MTNLNVLGQISKHNWLKFLRSTIFTQRLIGRIFSIFIIIYFIGVFSFAGYFIDEIILKILPKTSVQGIVNKYILLFFLVFLIIRFFIQKLPKLNLIPYLHLPISKTKLARTYFLFALINIYNFIPVLIILPYWVKVLSQSTVIEASITWLTGFILLSLLFSILALLLKMQFVKKPSLFIVLMIIIIGAYTLELNGMGMFFTNLSNNFFEGLLNSLYYLLLIPLVLFTGVGFLTLRSIKKAFYFEIS